MKKNFVLLLVLISSIAFADALTGLIAHYTMNGTANDFSGNSQTGTIYGASYTTDRFGNASSALYFDGNDYFATPLYRQNYSYFSVSLWFRYTGSTSDSYRALVGSNTNGFGASSQSFFIGKDSGNSNIGVQDQYNYYANTMAVGTNAWNGGWHHIAYTFSNGTAKIYLDGVAYNSTTFSKDGGQIFLGLEPEGSGYYFLGAMDEVRFYNRALSSSDVVEVYNMVPEPSSLFLAFFGILCAWILRKK